LPVGTLASLSGAVAGDAFVFSTPLAGPDNRPDPTPFILDTGAFEMLLTAEVATALHLPKLGPIEIGGVGGSAAAYRSRVTIVLGTHTFGDTPCVVDPSFPGPSLFGLRFFIDNRLALTLDPASARLTILTADVRPSG
jgi:hypothetical protein